MTLIDPPPNRRKFVHEWDETRYTYDKAEYWLHYRRMPSRAKPYVERLRKLVAERDPNHEVILGARIRALIADFDDDLDAEIAYTRRVIDMSARFIQAGPPTTIGPTWSDIRDDLELLALLYADYNQQKEALDTVEEIAKFCFQHGLRFNKAELRRRILS